MSANKVKYFLLLHLIILMYSLSAILAKYAALSGFFSIKFFVFYGIDIFILFLYAIFWQQIIKRMDLMVAYSNKAIVIIWVMKNII